MHSLGLTLEDFGDQFDIKVWPDNWRAVSVFHWLGSQWNVGPGGPVGLRYEAFAEARVRFGISPQEWVEIVDDVRLMEVAARAEMLRAVQQNRPK